MCSLRHQIIDLWFWDNQVASMGFFTVQFSQCMTTLSISPHPLTVLLLSFLIRGESVHEGCCHIPVPLPFCPLKSSGLLHLSGRISHYVSSPSSCSTSKFISWMLSDQLRPITFDPKAVYIIFLYGLISFISIVVWSSFSSPDILQNGLILWMKPFLFIYLFFHNYGRVLFLYFWMSVALLS